MKIKAKELSDLANLVKVLEQLGVEQAFGALREDPVKPEMCLKKARISLDLMAYHGGKWCNEEWLPAHLERLRLKDGKVRFLLSQDIVDENKQKFAALQNRFPKTFFVRLFNRKALFRCIFIDNQQMIFTHYGHEVILNDGTNSRGWESPQLIVDMSVDWSLAIPFKQLFSELWEDASPLTLSNTSSNITTRNTREFQ